MLSGYVFICIGQAVPSLTTYIVCIDIDDEAGHTAVTIDTSQYRDTGSQ